MVLLCYRPVCCQIAGPKLVEFRNWLHSDFGLKTVLVWGDPKAIVIGEQGHKGEVIIQI